MTLYSKIKQKYNKNTNNIIKNYSKRNKLMANLKSSTTFLIKCRNIGIIPNFIINSTKNVQNIFQINKNSPPNLVKTLEKHIYKFHIQILKLLIQEKHKQIKENSELLLNSGEVIGKHLDEHDLESYLESENQIYESLTKKNKTNLIRKLEILKEQYKRDLHMKHNIDWFVNKTEEDIPTNIQWLLSLGPKFALPNTKETFPLFKCIAEGEDCVQTLENKDKQEISRTKLVSLIDDHLNKNKLNKREQLILNTVVQSEKYLKRNKEILILNSDKGNITVAMNKTEYNNKMKDILKDMCTYRRLKRDPTSVLQSKNNALIEKLFNINAINVTEKNKLIARVATAPRIYGLPKIHKEGTPLRPICSSINSPSYGLCKYLCEILKNITKNSQYNVKDAIEFKSKIKNINIEDDETLISFDVVSLFPSVPVNLALKIISEKWNILEGYTCIPKDFFLELVKFCIKDSRYFKYDEKFFEQTKGMPMGSPASPIIADIVMEELLDVSIKNMKTKPKILTKYVDDLFGIIRKDDIEDTLKTLNEFNRQIQFTMERECNNKLPYLDAVVLKHGNRLLLDWYQKPMASGRLINFYSKHPRRIIINTATNFINRVLHISDREFHKTNLIKIRNILYKNDFPRHTVNYLITHVNDKKHSKNVEKEKPPKIYKSVTYIPGLSERIKNSDIYNREKVELALKTHNTVNKIFSKTKSKLEKDEQSNLVYRIKCNGTKTDICQKTYVGTTKTKLKTRISSHRSDLKATDKPLEQKTALANHCAVTGHLPDFNNVDVLVKENNYKRRYALEMLHIINEPTERRLNYKIDTESCARIYRHTIEKYKLRRQ